MENYTPLLKEVVKIKTNIPLIFLDYLKFKAETSLEWHFLYGGNSIEEKIPKLDITNLNSPSSSYIKGLISSIFFQVYEEGGKNYFQPEMIGCGISIKDKFKKDNIHTDYVEHDNTLRILGLLNIDWNSNWGGGFIWNNQITPLQVNEFLIFDPKVPHAASEIFCDKKRLAVDITTIANG